MQVRLQLGKDHIERLARAEPWTALAELIWNGLDAEATKVTVSITTGGLTEDVTDIVVADNGHGFTHFEATTEFGNLGDSWKRFSPSRMSRNRRVRLHGEKGQGRFKAFALGNNVRWTSVSEADLSNQRVTVSIHRDSMLIADVPDEPMAVPDPPGTVVEIFNTELPKANWLLKTEHVVNKLTELFALHLRQYPTLTIEFVGHRIDPSALIDHTASYTLDGEGVPAGVQLEVLEWRPTVDRSLHLCDADGFSLHEMAISEVRAPTFNFTAYIRWNGFRQREEQLGLGDLNEDLRPILDAAREQLREHFRERSERRDANVIRQWKDEDLYPYDDDPSGVLERGRRDLFDITALTVNAANAQFAKADHSTKKLTLRLLREAVELSPESLTTILMEVGKLDKQRLDELAGLLQHTELPKIIAAAREVTSRIVFLAGLGELVFEHQDVVNERQHLHKILEAEPWIFGDAWRDAVSEKTLTNVLRQHLKVLGRNDLTVDEPVVDDEGNTRRRIDLMFSGVVPGVGHRNRQHLVVELKGPGVRLNLDHLTQIRRYAGAVVRDQRFADTETWWEFWLVGSELDDLVIEEAYNQTDREPGVASNGRNYRVIVKRWSQLIEENRRRLEFMRTLLETDPNSEDALDHLRRTHAKHLPDDLAEKPSALDDPGEIA